MLELASLHLHTSRVSIDASSPPPSIALWHSFLVHASTSWVQLLASRGLLGLVTTSYFDCVSYQLGKQLTLLFNNSDFVASAPFDFIYYDV